MPEDIDSLAHLEQQISRVVEHVSVLRKQNAELAAALDAARVERDQAVKARLDFEQSMRATAAAAADAEKLRKEAEDLRTERKQVRTRIEKLLGQMDLLEEQ